ncbi:MAG: glycosyltransferase [Chloroflexota bacterium]
MTLNPEQYRAERIQHWDNTARQNERHANAGRFYHRRLEQVYRFLVPPGQRVLEIGCGSGDLLAALQPAAGVGVDFSPEMLRRAQARHPQLTFIQADAHQFNRGEVFDVIILSDLVHDLWDVQQALKVARCHAGPATRIVLNFYSRLWELPLGLARALRLAHPVLNQNWLTTEDVANLLRLEDMEVVRSWREVLLPLPVPLLAPFLNRVLVKLFPFNHAALTNFVLARPTAVLGQPTAALPGPAHPPLVSVIVPARNEAGNIDQIFARTPEMGAGTELVFVEGHSTDDTYAAIEAAIAAHPQRRCRLLRQAGKGKGDAVRLGFNEACGEALMILDADLTVPPEDLPRFYDALASNKAEFVNGVRLIYPMEAQAMRFLNLLGNKFFSLVFSWLLGQTVKDTLCGTKVLWKKDYQRIAANRSYFGDFDPFGDFDLIFGAARLGLKHVDVPIRYRERKYGATNIQRWKHGALLLRMVAFAAGKIKFI